MDPADAISEIKARVRAGNYRLGLHAVRHMMEEGFDEDHIVDALLGEPRVLEEYPEESRCLVLGYCRFTARTRSPLHLVCDLSQNGVVGIVTAYIPLRPWWSSPTRRGR